MLFGRYMGWVGVAWFAGRQRDWRGSGCLLGVGAQHCGAIHAHASGECKDWSELIASTPSPPTHTHTRTSCSGKDSARCVRCDDMQDYVLDVLTGQCESVYD